MQNYTKNLAKFDKLGNGEVKKVNEYLKGIKFTKEVQNWNKVDRMT